MTACADLFFKALGDEYAFVPEGELARTMGAAARIHVLTALANEVAVSMEGDDEMREVEVASAWLALTCACIRERNPGVVARASSRAVCFVSCGRANAAVRLSRFAVWRFEAL